MKLPAQKYKMISKQRQAIFLLKGKHNFDLDYNPSLEEITDLTGMGAEKIQEIENLPAETTSLNEPVEYGGEYGAQLVETIPDENSPSTDHSALLNNNRAFIKALIAALNPAEKFVIEERFGINRENELDYSEKTLAEIGRITNRSRERIRQIEESALNKMHEAALRIDPGFGEAGFT